jgi:LuxR family maltose regulon positive regulatory protein
LPPAESILTALVNDLCSLASNVVLVLDDYHVIDAATVHNAIAFLLDHLPPQVHVVIATRADPHLPLARWRSRGQSVEIRADDLRFTTDEAAAFLNLVMGLTLSAEDVATLEARTEGWIAGLQMAALSMHGRQDISRFIQSFSGSHRYVLDYLAEEVLNRQPENVQTFLLQTSILERLCGPLCDAVRDQGLVIRDQETALIPDHRSLITNHRSPIHDSQSILEYLDHANLFIVPLDNRREWYRYHRLLSDLLRKRLGQTQPDSIPTLHRRASDWYERQGHLEEAVEHAFSALDYPRAARLVEEVAEAVLMRSEVATLQRWLDRLPDADLTTRPTLCVYHAWTLLQSNHPLEVIEARLDRAASEDEHSSSQAAVLRAYIAVYQGRLSRAAALARQALEHLTHQDAFLRSLGLIVLATCELADGSPEAGYQALEQAARIGERSGNVMASVIVLANLAENHQKEGRLHKSEALCRRALDLAVDSQGNRLPIAGWPLIVLGELMRERNQLESAARCLEEGIELIHQWGIIAAYPGYIALARLRQAQGDSASALAALEEARHIALSTDVTEIDDYIVAVAQASFSIDQGDLEAATQWAERRELLRDVNEAQLSESEQYLYAHLRKYEQTVLARLWLAQGRTEEALQLLDGLLPKAEKARRMGMTIEVQGLRAMALHALGNDGGALLALENALALAEPEGYVRIFVDQGAPMAALLRQAASRGIAPDYVGRLLASFGSQTSDSGFGAEQPALRTPHSAL